MIRQRAERRGRMAPLRIVEVKAREWRRELFQHCHDLAARDELAHSGFIAQRNPGARGRQAQIERRIVRQDARANMD